MVRLRPPRAPATARRGPIAEQHVPSAEARLGVWRAPPGAAEIALPLLLRLRWLIATGQSALLLLAGVVARADLPYLEMAALVAVLCASNAWLERWPDRTRQARALPALLALDTLLLTVQLALSGGPLNPFTALYVVYVALACVALSRRGTAWIALLSGACYAAMFLWHLRQPLWEVSHAHGQHGTGLETLGPAIDTHVVGMWLAFSVVGALIAYFVGRLSEELVNARAVAARNDRLASLTTLAAGAAHELGSPLGTIAVAAREIERDSSGAVLEDAQLIRAEVQRCRQILDRMSGAAAERMGEAEPRTLESILARVCAERGGDRLRVVLAERCRGFVAQVEPLQQALGALLRNALDASSGGVELRVDERGREIHFEITDAGSGIRPEAMAHIGEPFFTTKEPGKGTGLGLYVVRLIAERLGGRLVLRSAQGRGTQAVLALPARSIAGGAA